MSFDSMDVNSDSLVDREEYLLAARDALLEEGASAEGLEEGVFRIVANLYDTCDLDGDGFLSEPEIEYAQFLAAFCEQEASADRDGVVHWNAGESEFDNYGETAARELLSSFDLDGDGQVIFDELAMMIRHVTPSMRRAVHGLFRKADIVRDGGLNSRELQYAIFLINDHSMNDLGQRLQYECDRNWDGVVTRDEVEAGVQAARQQLGAGNALVEYLLDYFDMADANGDGALDDDEMKMLAWYVIQGAAGATTA